MHADHAIQVGIRRRRYGWRLKALLGLNFLLLGLFVLSRLTPPQAKRLGPWGQSLYEVFNPPAVPTLSQSGRELVADVKALGGDAHWMGRTPGRMGFFGGTDTFAIAFNGREFSDQELAHLVRKHRNQIWGLDLRNTNVTDEGLRQLQEMPNLEQLTLGNDVQVIRQFNTPTSPITDAGLVHLRKLDQLRNLTLNGLPITDEGLAVIENLPNLGGLYLSRTKVKGADLSRFKSLSKLAALYLDRSAVSDAAMNQLAGASNLQVLSLNRVSLTADGLKPLKALPRLQLLEITGCGLLDEEVQELQMSKPELKIERR